MIVVFVLLIFFVAVLSYLFFAPFYFEINSIEGVFRFRFHQIASATLKLINNEVLLELKVFWWSKQIDLFQERGVPKKKKVKKVKRKKNKGSTISFLKIKRVLASFKINKLFISIDTGDMQLNGILFPVFYWIGVKSRKVVRINFVDETIVILEIKNSMARMVWAYIKP